MEDEINQSLQDAIQRMEDGRAAEEERRGAVEELKTYLGERQRERAFEDPYGSPKITVTNHTGIYLALRPHEREEVENHEQAVFERHKPVAQEKASQKTTYLMAGGSEVDFEQNWREYGHELALQGRAADIEARAHEEGSIF